MTLLGLLVVASLLVAVLMARAARRRQRVVDRVSRAWLDSYHHGGSDR